MYFNQISVDGMGCLSYAIGCPRAKAMVLVDPKRDVRDYRSNIAASIMKQAGYAKAKSLVGGIFAWSNAGFPVVLN